MAGDLNRESRQQRNCSLFDLPRDFFDSARLVSDIRNDSISQLPSHQLVEPARSFTDAPIEEEKDKKKNVPRWSCNTCKVEFESLEEQRSHFKSDFHRFNVKLNVAGKGTIKEEDFDEFTGDSLSKDYEISSISGSEDDDEKVSYSNLGILDGLRKEGARVKQKVFISLQSGDTVSVWKCMLVDESEDLSFDKNNLITQENCGSISCFRDEELMKLLKCLIHEPRNKTHLRIVLLASGGHFAGCVFDGNSVIIHKTFHRYVIRAKAGKRQSTKDATGKAAKSAGASLRRYNEMALKKEIQELLTAWKPFFDASLCVFLYAPSINRQLFFDGEKPYFSHHNCRVRHIPFSVRRPTLKEAKRIYLQLTHLVYELDMKGCSSLKEDLSLSASVVGESNEAYKDLSINSLENNETYSEAWSDTVRSDGPSLSNMSEIMVTSIHINEETPLHEAAMSGNAQQTLELLEQGLNPCVKDSRGRTPYMLATEKEVRNTFRRFMALNLDKWDWHAANVPSPLTEEMEASQAAKQAEKDAKRKAKAKELKKVRKAKEKAEGQAQAAITQSSSTVPPGQQVVSVANRKAQIISSITSHISKEEELKKTQAEEREKRAAAAEKRIAAQKALGASTSSMPQSCSNAKGVVTEGSCSCCMASLAGKIPFHRYHYKYCSTSCMHVHREMLEDG